MKTCCLNKFAVLSLPALLVALWAMPASAGPAEELVERYPAKSIASVSQADAALADIKPVREQIERIFADDRKECFERFLVSSCLNDAKEKRRLSMHAVRRIEVEAKAFLRKDKAEERDRAVAERLEKAANSAKTIPISGTARDGADGPDAAEPEAR
ncbi:MAG: hypothetical protein RL404_1940 [Pseudomonadota bacterium]|jgi:hypothetical protein